jgi:hypothetical protein
VEVLHRLLQFQIIRVLHIRKAYRAQPNHLLVRKVGLKSAVLEEVREARKVRAARKARAAEPARKVRAAVKVLKEGVQEARKALAEAVAAARVRS